jgi:nitroreductase
MLDQLIKRRSVRQYKNIEIEKEKIDILAKAALLSPSSRNFQPWEFIFVLDKKILFELSKTKVHGSDFIKNAGLGIAVIADPGKCDVWIEDASIASIIIQIAAESIGLSSCWIQVRKRFHNDKIKAEDFIKKLLMVPENFKVLSLIAVGYGNENPEPHSLEKLKYDKVHLNNFNNEYKIKVSAL